MEMETPSARRAGKQGPTTAQGFAIQAEGVWGDRMITYKGMKSEGEGEKKWTVEKLLFLQASSGFLSWTWAISGDRLTRVPRDPTWEPQIAFCQEKHFLGSGTCPTPSFTQINVCSVNAVSIK